MTPAVVMPTPVRDALVRTPGAVVDLASIDARSTPVGPQDKAAGVEALHELSDGLAHRQEALWAQARGGGQARVLVVLQGMDTSGKGGAVRALGRVVSPQGLHVAQFGRPTGEELAHDFLWRVRRRLPVPGTIGVFDRSHYEDVLVARVEALVDEAELQRRARAISELEAELVASGTSLVKVFLHLSPGEQHERLLARLDNPEKQWKYSPDDLAARSRWSEYQQVYAEVLAASGTTDGPWFVVPADRKWYRSWAVAALLDETLAMLDPQLPAPTYDVAEQRLLLVEQDPLR